MVRSYAPVEVRGQEHAVKRDFGKLRLTRLCEVFRVIQKIKRISGTPPDWKRGIQATNKYKLSGGVCHIALSMTRSRFLLIDYETLHHEILLLSLRQEKNKCNKFVSARAIALALVLAVLLPWS